MDHTRRTLEGEFVTTTRDSTPQLLRQDPSVEVAEGSSRKRRLSNISLGYTSIPTGSVSRKVSAVTPGSFVIDTQDGKSPATVDALVRENARLKFELDNAKSLQKVLETNICTIRDQLISQKSASMTPHISSDHKNHTGDAAIKNDTPSNLKTSVDVVSFKATIAEKEAELLSVKNGLEDQISKLKNTLSTVEDQKAMITTENDSLRAKVLEIQDACAACHAECRAMKEALAEQEDSTLKTYLQPLSDTFGKHQNDLEVKLLQERLERAEMDASAELAAAAEKLEKAESKIRCLEQLTKSQDEGHLKLLNAQDEIATWKSLFSYISKDVTPQVLLHHVQDIEQKVSELEKSQLKSATTPEKSTEEKIIILQNNVSSLEEENLHLRKKIKDLDCKSNLSRDQEAKYNEKIDSLSDEVAMLREKLGSGHFNLETTKVLHMKRNPFHDQKVDSLQARITSLEAENHTLQSRIKDLDAGLDTGIAAQSELKIAHMQGEITVLQKKLSDVQKGSERLKQVFTRQINMLRESIPKIFGYQLEMVSDPNSKDSKATFTLRPQGSDSNSKFVFKLLSDGSMSLIENNFTKKLSKEVETFIKKFNSIPGFIANMTLENFQKQEN